MSLKRGGKKVEGRGGEVARGEGVKERIGEEKGVFCAWPWRSVEAQKV